MSGDAAMGGRDAAGRAEPAAGARLTPYELVFAGTPFETEGFPALQEEAEARGVDAAEPERFLLLATAGRLLRELGADDAMLEPAGMLLFHAYHFWLHGLRVYTLEPELGRALPDLAAAAREATGESAPRAAEPHLPPAGYLRLPRNLFWARVDEAATPEPADGLFWTLARGDDAAPPARLDVLLALGLRPGRPGLSVIPVGEPLAGRTLAHLARDGARPDGKDFENVLPGGELEGLLALTTPAEVLELFALVWRYVELHPEAVGDVVAPAQPAPASPPHVLPPSRLPHRPIRRV